ncbi:mitochondrial outer membrane translocase complex, subunit Tom20 domain-containing protein [Phycomyces blakesleeanus]|uniref:Mitochondrial outer membrane translocase complex, subunit Tom20 domain-containing protein n=1 Tax=Phycomyces blakesleeanus TaxID=4837 RepID=A0ABR3AQW9_PHYBL
MDMRPQTIALTAAATLAALSIGYMVYFDYSRRSDPDFKKKLRRDRKMAAKAAKESEESSKMGRVELIEQVIIAAAQENYPTTPEEKEQYFMSQVAAGEALCAQGEPFYNEAILPFYKALKVYPAPMELIMIYQKTLPPPVFENIANIMAIEQQAAAPEEFKTETVEIEIDN